MQSSHRIDSYEDEIELMDYLLVVWEWKYIIIAGTLAFGLAAAIISFVVWKQQPKMYRSSVVLKLDTLNINEIGNKVYVDSPKNIKTFIENDLKYKMFKYVSSSKKKKISTSSWFQVDIPKYSAILNVSLVSTSAEEGNTKTDYLINALFDEYANKVNDIKGEHGEQEDSEHITLIEKTINKQIDEIKLRLSKIEAHNRIIEDKIELLDRQRESFVKENDQHEVQKAIKAVSNELKAIETINKNVTTNQQNLNQKQIEKLEKKKSDIQAFQILQAPVTTELPKNNQIKRNVMLSSVMGIFLTLFLSFLLEYIRVYKTTRK